MPGGQDVTDEQHRQRKRSRKTSAVYRVKRRATNPEAHLASKQRCDTTRDRQGQYGTMLAMRQRRLDNEASAQAAAEKSFVRVKQVLDRELGKLLQQKTRPAAEFGKVPPELSSQLFAGIVPLLQNAGTLPPTPEILRELRADPLDLQYFSMGGEEGKPHEPMHVPRRRTMGIPTVGKKGQLMLHPYRNGFQYVDTISCRPATPTVRVLALVAQYFAENVCGIKGHPKFESFQVNEYLDDNRKVVNGVSWHQDSQGCKKKDLKDGSHENYRYTMAPGTMVVGFSFGASMYLEQVRITKLILSTLISSRLVWIV